MGFPGGSNGKESTCNAGDLSSVPGLGRSPGEENSYPLQYSCQGNPMDRGGWRATVHRVAKETELDMTMPLDDNSSNNKAKRNFYNCTTSKDLVPTL